MNLSISNLAWNESENDAIYNYIKENGFSGIEIAPKKIFSQFPDGIQEEIDTFRLQISTRYALEIASMQSIWFGCTENIFSSKQERTYLLDYTKKIIKFAEKLFCKNIVFGCPRNRAYTGILDYEIAFSFFYDLGCFAIEHNTVIALEANPLIYGTNFLNTTSDTIDFVKKVNCDGLKVNLDTGTIIQNNENITSYAGDFSLISHVHISEPNLELIQKRQLHNMIADMLRQNVYNNYVSIEMKYSNNIDKIKKVIRYIKSVFD